MSCAPIVALRDLSFSYDSAQDFLITHLSVHFPIGFTGVVGANGSGKSTLLQLISGSQAPGKSGFAGVVEGTIEGAGDAVYCEQRTDNPPHKLLQFLEDWDSDACELRGRLGIQLDWLERWDCLSHGERKRAQIATALWQKPTVLAIDEPTNHIDSHARALLVASLQQYRGVGLIVSHDRDLLDSLCIQCLWLQPPTAAAYPGGFTQARQQRDLAQGAEIRQRENAVRDQRRLEREVKQRREQAASKHQRRSKRGLATKDSDAREKIDRARVADSKAGRSLRQLDGRTEQLNTRLQASKLRKEYQTGIGIPGVPSVPM
jgi:macrolide transport system ATP-binding/permease protein